MIYGVLTNVTMLYICTQGPIYPSNQHVHIYGNYTFGLNLGTDLSVEVLSLWSGWLEIMYVPYLTYLGIA